jgi:hypothetical protein
MTNQIDPQLLTTVLQLLTTECSSGFAEGLRLLVNEAMVQERSAVLQARPYERCEDRLGRANGFNPRTLASRVGPLLLSIPQVRDGVDFYPSALEKGARSEKALLLALAIHPRAWRAVALALGRLCLLLLALASQRDGQGAQRGDCERVLSPRPAPPALQHLAP